MSSLLDQLIASWKARRTSDGSPVRRREARSHQPWRLIDFGLEPPLPKPSRVHAMTVRQKLRYFLLLVLAMRSCAVLLWLEGYWAD
jgi:hypothetical protein